MGQKRDIAPVMQERLAGLFAQTGLSISEFARRFAVDRSTFSQLLSSDQFRMPRADTVAALAEAFGVSTDYLLGLSEDPQKGMELIDSALSVVANADPVSDTQWQKWHDEARDAKIRYVSVTALPHHLKNKETILYEFTPLMGAADAKAYIDSGEFDAEIARRSYDYEVCSSIQALQTFADGSWLWRDYPVDARRAQLLEAADTLDALYPDYQVYLFDEMKILTCPIMIFGQQRAVVNCAGGAGYLIFNRPAHIAFFTRLFKDMIRHTAVHPHQTAAYMRDLAGQVR